MPTQLRPATRKCNIIFTLLASVILAFAPTSGALADGGSTTNDYQEDYYENYFYSEGTCDARGSAMRSETPNMAGWKCYQNFFQTKWSMGIYWYSAGGGGGGDW